MEAFTALYVFLYRTLSRLTLCFEMQVYITGSCSRLAKHLRTYRIIVSTTKYLSWLRSQPFLGDHVLLHYLVYMTQTETTQNTFSFDTNLPIKYGALSQVNLKDSVNLSTSRSTKSDQQTNKTEVIGVGEKIWTDDKRKWVCNQYNVGRTLQFKIQRWTCQKK